jgi:hypothetical protein
MGHVGGQTPNKHRFSRKRWQAHPRKHLLDSIGEHSQCLQRVLLVLVARKQLLLHETGGGIMLCKRREQTKTVQLGHTEACTRVAGVQVSSTVPVVRAPL